MFSKYLYFSLRKLPAHISGLHFSVRWSRFLLYFLICKSSLFIRCHFIIKYLFPAYIWTFYFIWNVILGTRDQIANIHCITEKAREFQKNIYFCYTDYAKAFDCVDHNKLWKSLQEMRIPDHLICFLRNLYAHPEATVRTRHGTIDWFQTGKSMSRMNIITLLI